MADIALRDYEKEIDQFIEEARYVEALAHTRHIISQHPHYIGAYYLLGKMMLDANQPELAIDLFRRVLNGDPEHLMARIGLTLTYQQADNLDAAIWNLERAVELAPDNADLADELCQLYGRRDGIEMDYVPLSRSSLARLYIRGNLAGRAVEELRALLANQEDRADLWLALAEAYWRDDQIVQAADTCQAILDKLPYCLKANLLLGTLWANSGQEEGQIYLDRAQAVDLENTMATALFGISSPLKPRDVMVERLVYTPSAVAVDRNARWYQQLESASVSIGISEAMPDMTAAEVRVVDITAGLESQIEIPDWLRELGDEGPEGSLSWMSDIGTATDAEQELSEAEIPEWLRSDEAAAIAEDQEIPDWLMAFHDEEPVAESTAQDLTETEPVTTIEPDWLGELESEPVSLEAMPEWLEELTPTTKQTPSDEEMPDWLQALQPAGVDESLEEAVVPAEEIPDWLSEIKPAEVIEGPDETSLQTEVLSDWLREQQAAAEGIDVEEETGYAEVEEEGETSREPELAIEEGELPDWLTGFQVEGIEAPAVSLAAETFVEEVQEPTRVTEDIEETELPDRLSELRPAEVKEPEGAPVEDVEISDWLNEPQPAAASEESTEGDFLTWLDELQPGETEMTSPESDLDWEKLAEETEGAETISWETAPEAEGDLLSGDDALAWLESLTAGNEEDLRVQAEAEAQVRVDEILGRKRPAPVEPVAETPVEKAEGAFGWDAFGEKVTEAALTEPATESELDWEALAKELDMIGEVAETAPSTEDESTVEGDLLSGDDALAWLESLTVGKEEDLRAQAEAEAQTRVDEILGRKRPVLVEPFAETPVEKTEGAFGWEAFGEEITEVAPAEPVAESELDWEALAEELTEPGDVIEAEPVTRTEHPSEEEEVAPSAEGDVLSGDDALAWLESLTFGKEETLRAQAEAEAQARVDEILGRKPTSPVAPAVEEPATEEPSAEETISTAETISLEEVVPSAEGDLLSGDDALAWLESLMLGKEDELHAQAELEAQARVNEILGRKPEAPPPPELVEPEPPAPEEPVMPQVAPEPQQVEAQEAPETDLASLNYAALRDYVNEHPGDYRARLALARAALAAGDIDEALEHYAQLVQVGAETKQILADLEQANTDYPQNTRVLQTLGDAYMTQGLVDQALGYYNQAMNLL